VSQFAAGCAVCGADLEAHRAQRSARRLPRASLSARARLPLDWWLVPALALMALVMPLLGILLAFLAAAQRDNAGDRAMRNAFVAVAVLGIVVFLIPGLRFGVVRALLT